MNVCIFGEHSSVIPLVERLSNKYRTSLFVDTIEICRSIDNNVGCEVIYNPVELERHSVFLICVEVPYSPLEYSLNFNLLLKYSKMVKNYAAPDSIVVVGSAVPVGTTRKIFKDSDFYVLFSSTLLNVVDVDEYPLIIGGIDDRSEVVGMKFLNTLFGAVLRTGNLEVAEAAILFKNTNALVQKAFLNEFAEYCESIDLDPYHVIEYDKCNNRYSPWIGHKSNEYSSYYLLNSDEWPILSAATRQIESRPRHMYDKIVSRFCGNNKYDELYKKSFLVVGLGSEVGSLEVDNSPALQIIKYLELEGALVTRFDLFIDRYSTMPDMFHNSGAPRFDGIVVLLPYLVSTWEKFDNVLFLCRH